MGDIANIYSNRRQPLPASVVNRFNAGVASSTTSGPVLASRSVSRDGGSTDPAAALAGGAKRKKQMDTKSKQQQLPKRGGGGGGGERVRSLETSLEQEAATIRSQMEEKGIGGR